MKTDEKERKLKPIHLLAFGIVLLLLFTIAPVTAGSINLTTQGTCVTINGGIFCNSVLPQATGSGVWGPFLRVDPKSENFQFGFNNDEQASDPTNPMVTYSGQANDTFTHALFVSTIPEVEYNGTLYRRVDLDSNQAGTDLLSIDLLKVYLTTDRLVHNYSYCDDTFNGVHYTPIYNLNNGCSGSTPISTDWISLLGFGPGSGGSDMSFLIPDAAFSADPNCNYGGTGCTQYLVMYYYAGMVGHGGQNTDGFEEWAIIYFPAVTVVKTAAGSETVAVDWTITKEPNGTFTGFTGDTFTHDYTVSVNRTDSTSSRQVTGNITITNPATFQDEADRPPAVIESVTDAIGAIAATVSCPPLNKDELGPGQTTICTYTVTNNGLPSSGTNTANVTISDGEEFLDSILATAGFTLAPSFTGEPASITVTDTNGPSWGPVSADTSWNYNKTFECDGDEGSHVNTATIVQTGESDDATVTVDCYALEVTKNAQTSATKNCTWTLDKSVDHDSWSLFAGDSAVSEFTLTPFVDCDDSGFGATGNITIHNPAPIAATVNEVSDVVSPAIVASVDCNATFPYTLAAGGDLDCTYSVGLPNEDTRTNTATATLQNYAYDPPAAPTLSGTTDFSGTAQLTFGAATTIVHECVNLDDTNDGPGEFVDPGELCFDDDLNPVYYNVTYTCGESDTYPNTANLTDSVTDELLDSDDESVNVVCRAASGAEKNATTSYTRTWNWTINKLADQTNLTLESNQTFVVNYNVTVNATSTDSDWAANGFITITNSLTDRELDIASIIDTLDSVTADVTCGSTTVDPLGSLVCSYSADLSNTTDLINTANISASYNTVTCYWNGTAVVCDVNGGSEDVSHLPTADVLFNGPTSIIDECVNLTDSQYGDLGIVCADEVPETKEYSITIGPFGECGEFTFENCASFVTNDTGATDQSCWTVFPTIPCPEGCTLTPGYWKTHSVYGPAAHPDDTWYLLPGGLGPDTLFFQLKVGGVNQTWYNVFWTNPKGGNAYYILAHQYEAAVLNSLAGADVPPNVATAISQAAALLDQYDGTPNSFDGLKGKNAVAVRNQFITLAGILGNYNTGIIGPGHCDEDGTSAPG